VEVPVGVGVPDGVDVGVEEAERVKDRLQLLAVVAVGDGVTSCALGMLEGTLGATGSCLSWYSLMAVKTATPAKMRVNIKTITIPSFPLIKLFISFVYFQPKVA
jgi:hypothetical protein